MKKLLLVASLVTHFFGSAICQTNSVIPTENAQWKELHITIAGPKVRYTVLCGDTTINQQLWSKAYMVSVDTNLQVDWSIYRGALRIEGQKVYLIPTETSDPILLYDFDLEAGDTFDLVQPWSNWVDKIVVKSTEELLISGKVRKVIHFEPYNWGYEEEYWVEGIGSNLGLLNRGSGQGPDYGTYLSCFRHNDELINITQQPCEFPEIPECPFLSNNNHGKANVHLYLTPNPANETVTLSSSEADSTPWNLKVHDIAGKLILERKEVELPLKLDISDWQDGTYLFTVKLNGKTTMQGTTMLVKTR